MSSLQNLMRRAKEPRFWPELVRKAGRRLLQKRLSPSELNAIRTELVTMAVDAPGAMKRLGFSQDVCRSFSADHPARFAAAEERVASARGRLGGGADLNLLFSICRATRPKRVVETGVAYGWSSLAILSALDEEGEGQLISIDLPYLTKDYDDLVGLVVPPELRKRWTLYRGADRECLPKVLKSFPTIDLTHYDSDKSYQGRRWAYPRLFEALRPGGILISDDIEDNRGLLDFAADVGIKPIVVRASHQDKYVGLIQKQLDINDNEA